MICYHKIRNGLFFALLIGKLSYGTAAETSDSNSPLMGQIPEKNHIQLTYDPQISTPEHLREFEIFAKQYNATLIPVNSNKPMVRLLSLDGGGTRGFMTTLYLCYLTRLTKKPIHELFDSIIATSTGTLIAAAFGVKRSVDFPKVKFNIPTEEPLASVLAILNEDPPLSDYFTPDDMLTFYRQDSPIIFTKKGVFEKGSTYTDKYLIDYLKKYFGELTLDQLSISTYFTAHDMQNGIPVIFSRYMAKMSPSENFPLWQVIRGAVAAPTYFDPFEINGRSICDGGIDFNNPAPIGIFKVAQEFKVPDTNILTFSIGTGNSNLNVPHEQYATLGQVGWGFDLLGRMFSGKKSELLMTEKYLTYVQEKDLINHYFRISPELPSELLKTGETNPIFFEALEKISYTEINRLKHDFAHIGGILTQKSFEALSLPVVQTPIVPRRKTANIEIIKKSNNFVESDSCLWPSSAPSSAFNSILPSSFEATKSDLRSRPVTLKLFENNIKIVEEEKKKTMVRKRAQSYPGKFL